MKVKILIPFYSTVLGTVRKGEERDVSPEMAEFMILDGLAEKIPEEIQKEEKPKTAKKGKGRNTET